MMNTTITSGPTMDFTPETLEILADALKCGIINKEDVLKEVKMKQNEKIINQHPYKINQGKNGRWYTYLKDPESPKGRRQIAKSTKEKIYEAILADYNQRNKKNDLNSITLENLYEKWMIWRRDTGTAPKTITENKNEWNRFLKSNPIAHKKVREIRMYDLEDFFMQITTNHAITYKRLTNVKSMLNGLFKYGIRISLINDSPMHNVDFAQFQTRCKPENSVKDIYTLAEREAILQYLSAKTDIYSFAVQLAFYLCVRVGELITLKKSDIDIQDNKIYILRSARKQQILQDDLTFSPVEYTVEERIKGNKAQGFRFIPLTPQSKKLIEKIMDLYPDGDYLFMRNGHTLYTDSFNRYLKNKVCMPLKIPYRSSHQIRFTVATLLYEAGIPINQISAMLGHSETRTTMHYIRQQVADSKSRTIMSNLLDI
ncbi:MAG: site-specific integrase [Blautia sp.]|uniref:tyrosine-type recombinase/integrase n=1 Tax=Blautia sp. TaxID=1955243 RepID=UPI0026334B45|nr:site-specific integrase [Blautia sp.]MDD6412975.1 site-specific integrase [Blautia sp.]